MEIRNNPAGTPQMQTDITRPVREGIEKHTQQAKQTETTIEKRAKNARLKIKEELFAEMVRKRGQNYRKKIKPDQPLKSGPDRADFSGTARALSQKEEPSAEGRAERLADLKTRYEERRLDTQELIARTAARMLGDN